MSDVHAILLGTAHLSGLIINESTDTLELQICIAARPGTTRVPLFDQSNSRTCLSLADDRTEEIVVTRLSSWASNA